MKVKLSLCVIKRHIMNGGLSESIFIKDDAVSVLN
jgi:hypothetical protein